MTSAPTLPASDAHLENIAANLQLVADLRYGDVALVVPAPDGSLVVLADARPNTAFAPVGVTRVGERLDPAEEPEAYRAWRTGEVSASERRRAARGITFRTEAYPVGATVPAKAVILCDRADQVVAAPGTMERVFMQAADELIAALLRAPVTDVRDGSLFSTERRAGDGVLRVDERGVITYASPNAVTIMRHAGVTGQLVGLQAAELPGGGFGIGPVIGTRQAVQVETEVGERVLLYRSIGLEGGVLVLVEDRTEARRRETELKIKDATIREVHHRVKNNLQTIASLLRIQARRSTSPETRHALGEAIERVSSMAVVHDLLAAGDEERVDLGRAAAEIVELVRKGLASDPDAVSIELVGGTGPVEARVATSLALVLAELVHNAIEHGLRGRAGTVRVAMRRSDRELLLKVADTGAGLPLGFDPRTSTGIGLSIVRTIVEDDLHGTMAFSGTRGTTVTVRIPMGSAADARSEEAQ